MIQLKDVTLIAADCYNYGGAVNALQKSMQQCSFAKVKFLTDIPIKVDGIEVVQIPRIDSKEEYSRFMIKELHKYFNTKFVLVVQHDGYVINGDAWTDEFLEYDYIGAAWLYVDGRNVGNGGFSLRSWKLQTILGMPDRWHVTHPEDEVIGRLYRKALEISGIKFPSDELADRFAFELREPNQPTFGFHGHFHKPYKKHVVLKRSGAMGDCILMEPVIRWYCEQGWQVVLDMPTSFFELYQTYPYPIKHTSHFDAGRIKPELEINLDMAYEVFQDRKYTEAYFQMCGITDYKLTRPQLWPKPTPKTAPFEKYAVVHIDKRKTAERNSNGVDWSDVEKFLNEKGYNVIQIGYEEHEKCGMWMNTQTTSVMKWLISHCDLFIGVDSAPANIAIAYNKPCVLLFGSTDPKKIHVETDGAVIVQGYCEHSGCWHVKGATAGTECKLKGTDRQYQCTKHKTTEVITAISWHIHNNKSL